MMVVSSESLHAFSVGRRSTVFLGGANSFLCNATRESDTTWRIEGFQPAALCALPASRCEPLGVAYHVAGTHSIRTPTL